MSVRKVRKAVVTAASPEQRQLPLQRLVDRDGVEKSALRIVLEEAASAGVESIVVVHHPGDRDAYAKAAAEPESATFPKLHFVEQKGPRGYGHALLVARDAVGEEPFLHLVGDHLYLRHGEKSCARQVVEAAEKEDASISAVQPTREGLLTRFGAVGGPRLQTRSDAWTIEAVLEKPTPTEAEQKLVAPGLRAGHYLCFFGVHVLTPAVFRLLLDEIGQSKDGERVPLAAALARLCRQERHLALSIEGTRQDLGHKYGVLFAQIALAMSGGDRDEILTRLLELMIQREQREPREAREPGEKPELGEQLRR